MDSDWLEQGVLDVIKAKYWSFIPRRGSGRREERADPARPGAGGDREGRARRGAARGGADRPVRRDPARGDRGHAPGGRRAARASWPATTVTFVVNRNINVSNICIVGCAFCGFGQGRRSPDAYEHGEEEFVRRVRGGRRFRRDRDLHAVRGSIPTGRSTTTRAGCGWQAGRAAAASARVLGDGGRAPRPARCPKKA